MHSEVSTWVAVPPDALYPLVADLARWPERLPHYRYVRILDQGRDGTRAAMSAKQGAIPVFWEAIQTVDSPTRTIRFRHVRGLTRGMEVLWTFQSERGGTRATILHDLDLRWPLLGGWFAEHVVSRRFIHPIATRTLHCFKTLAEGVR